MLNVSARTTGGVRMEAVFAGMGKGGVQGVDVGFFSSARYPDGTPVAAVAAWNEFGTRKKDGSVHIPERPFMRNANQQSRAKIAALIKDRADPLKLVLDRALAELAGQLVQGLYQSEIVSLKEPANAEITVKGGWMRSYHGKMIYIKGKGSSNPLIDTGTMRTAVSYEVVE